MFENVCRLCLGTNDLLWAFDEKINHEMVDIIKTTSGVEILMTDSVTQMVCSRCCQLTIKMYQFRTTSMKNNLDLKTQWVGYNLAQLASAKKKESEQDNTLCESQKKNIPCVIPEAEKQSETASKVPSVLDRYKNAHHSIKKLVKKHPTWKLRIPGSYLNSHFEPCLSLQRVEVSESLKQREPLPKRMKKTTRVSCEQCVQTPAKKRNVEEVQDSSHSHSNKLVKRSQVFNRNEKIRNLVEKEKIALNKKPKEKTRKKSAKSSVTSDSGVESNVSAITHEGEEKPSPGQPNTGETVRVQRILSSGEEFEEKLKTQTDSNRDSRETPLTEVAEVDKTPPQVDKDSKLFTSRPILEKPRYDICNNEILIPSDLEIGQVRETTDMSRNPTDSEVLESDCSNMPNMSLLSVTDRTQILHTCKVCDSQHQNRRDLKQHMRKTHTMCPFCFKRFKKLGWKNRHLKNEHGINETPVALKEVKLELMRVDKSEEIRKKYPTTFEDSYDGDLKCEAKARRKLLRTETETAVSLHTHLYTVPNRDILL